MYRFNVICHLTAYTSLYMYMYYMALSDKLMEDLRQPKVIELMQYLSDPQWGYDKEKRLDDIPAESFRKLEVD